jgi:hypothetical protein
MQNPFELELLASITGNTYFLEIYGRNFWWENSVTEPDFDTFRPQQGSLHERHYTDPTPLPVSLTTWMFGCKIWTFAVRQDYST